VLFLFLRNRKRLHFIPEKAAMMTPAGAREY
jgi:hypothetical protein